MTGGSVVHCVDISRSVQLAVFVSVDMCESAAKLVVGAFHGG